MYLIKRWHDVCKIFSGGSENNGKIRHICVSILIYVYIHVHIWERERERLSDSHAAKYLQQVNLDE